MAVTTCRISEAARLEKREGQTGKTTVYQYRSNERIVPSPLKPGIIVSAYKLYLSDG